MSRLDKRSDAGWTAEEVASKKRGRPMGRLHQDDVRKKIQVDLLCRLLTDQALGKRTLDALQIKAIEILLRKSMPDLSATELTGANGGAVQLQALQVAYVAPPGVEALPAPEKPEQVERLQ